MQNPIVSSRSAFVRSILQAGPASLVFIVPLRKRSPIPLLGSILPGSWVAVPARITQQRHRIYSGNLLELEPLLPGFNNRVIDADDLEYRIRMDARLSPDSRSYRILSDFIF